MNQKELLDGILKLDNQLCFRLYTVSRNMTRLYQPYLDKYNLTYPQYVIMLVMFERREIDFKELSEIVDLRTGTLTPIIQKLEQLGYVQKVTNPNDQRKVNIALTEKGKQLNEDIIDVPLGTAEALKLDIESYQVLVKELDHMLDLLKTALD